MFSNNMAGTPSKPMLMGTDAEAIKHLHGLVDISRWFGHETLHRTIFSVPAVFAAYNIFMNAVDKMDQRCASVPCLRKEMKLHMSVWTAALDWTMNNTYTPWILRNISRWYIPKFVNLLKQSMLIFCLHKGKNQNLKSSNAELQNNSARRWRVLLRNLILFNHSQHPFLCH